MACVTEITEVYFRGRS